MTFPKHELLTAFSGIRYLVLGTQDESDYCRTMDAVVDAMAGMDVALVLGMERYGFDVHNLQVDVTIESEAAALAWLAAHRSELECHNGEIINAPAFIKEHCADELEQLACQIEEERRGQREIEGDYRSAVA